MSVWAASCESWNFFLDCCWPSVVLPSHPVLMGKALNDGDITNVMLASGLWRIWQGMIYQNLTTLIKVLILHGSYGSWRFWARSCWLLQLNFQHRDLHVFNSNWCTLVCRISLQHSVFSTDIQSWIQQPCLNGEHNSSSSSTKINSHPKIWGWLHNSFLYSSLLFLV